MSTKIDFDLLNRLLPATRQAGAIIMDIYQTEFQAIEKTDGSPVTEADRRAEAILLSVLKDVAPDINIISEENPSSHSLAPPDRFCLVDPLDGTKEFLKQDGKGHFTVNIGFIEAGLPVAGIVFAPALDALYTGVVGDGAYLNDAPISVRKMPPEPIAATSSSHLTHATRTWLADAGIEKTVAMGSSLKFCLLAEGRADLYPRFGPTMEWDTAAAHAVLKAAGGNLYNPDGSHFTYGKPAYRNGPFIAQTR